MKINFIALKTNSIIIFTKNPTLGKVKTRIAKSIGSHAALDIYKELLTITRDVVLQVADVQRLLFYSDAIIHEDLWSVTHFEKLLQARGDLGDRMSHAFKHALEISDKALIIGSDCPYITPEIITDAFKALDESDVVLGPTFDGGYYMLGMKKVTPFLFEDIPWSTTEVFQLTTDKLKSAKVSFWTGPQLRDIDHAEDWNEYKEQSKSN